MCVVYRGVLAVLGDVVLSQLDGRAVPRHAEISFEHLLVAPDEIVPLGLLPSLNAPRRQVYKKRRERRLKWN